MKSLICAICVAVDVCNAILNGDVAHLGQFPWMVYIQTHFDLGDVDHTLICGGSLVSVGFVLTAACCVHGPNRYQFMYMGLQYETDERHRVTLELKTVHTHPCFENRPSAMEIDAEKYNVALIELASPVTLSKYVQTIPLTSRAGDLYENRVAHVLGWFDNNEADVGMRLVSAKLVVLQMSECEEVSSVYGDSSRPLICALGDVELVCNGDEKGDLGGPLVVQDRHGFVQVGVTSHLSGNSSEEEDCDMFLLNVPHGFVRIDAHMQWLEETMRKRVIAYAQCPSSELSRKGRRQKDLKCYYDGTDELYNGGVHRVTNYIYVTASSVSLHVQSNYAQLAFFEAFLTTLRVLQN